MRPVPAARLSRLLVACHPRRWRERYGEEMLDVLDQHQASTRTVVNLAASVLSTHVDPAYRTGRPARMRLSQDAKRAVAFFAAGLTILIVIVGIPFGTAAWKDGHWYPEADQSLSAVAFSPHGAILVTAFGGNMDVLWDVTDLSRPQRLSQFEGGEPTALSPDGRTVATIAFSGRPALWDVADPRRPVQIATLACCDGNLLWGQAFSPDGQILAAAYYDRIYLWDVADPARPRLLRTLAAPVMSPPQGGVVDSSLAVPFSPQDIAFSPDGGILASATGTDQVTLWNVTDPARASRIAALGGAGDFIQAFAFSPRGNLLAAVTWRGTVLVYSLADPARPARTATVRGLLARARYPGGSSQPDQPLCDTCGPALYAVAFSPGGHTLTVVVDREEMSSPAPGRDTVFAWHVTGSGALGAVTAAARDVADSYQPFLGPGDRTVLSGSPVSSAWHAWALP
jgi:WD40 repeat protein